MKFIHISDVNLGLVPDKGRAWSDARASEIEETFKNIISACNEEDVRLLLIAGNLFYMPPSEDELERLDEMLMELRSARTVIIAGGNDYIAPGYPAETYKFRSKTVILPRSRTTNAYLKGINTCITGYSYGQPEYGEEIIDSIAPGREGAINILLACGGAPGKMPFSIEKLARKGFDYVALGGMSAPHHILKNRIAYSGSPEPLTYHDSGRRGYILGEITDSGTRIKWVPISKRAYLSVTADISKETSDKEIMDNLFNRLRKQGYDNIYTITLKGVVERPVRLDFSRIRERFNIYAVVDKTLSTSDEKRIYLENAGNLLGMFIDRMKGSYELSDDLRNKAVRYGIEALYSAGDKR